MFFVPFVVHRPNVGSGSLSHRRGQRIAQHGLEQAVAIGLGLGELGLQLVADRHQLVDLGDDALLFGKGRDWKGSTLQVGCAGLDRNPGQRCARRA